MIDPYFVLLGAAFSLSGSLRYVYLTLRGRTIPNRVSWFCWATAPLVGFFAQLSDGVGLPAVLTLSIGVGPAMILLASFLNPAGYWKITRFDLGCGAISLLALVVWLATDNPTLAVVLSVFADLAGGVPTVIKSWRAPRTESPLVFGFAGANGVITLLTIDTWTVSTWAFGVYITVLGIGLSLIVLLRSRRERTAPPTDLERPGREVADSEAS